MRRTPGSLVSLCNEHSRRQMQLPAARSSPFLPLAEDPSQNEPSPLADGDEVIVGRVKGAWGVHGDLKVDALTDYADRFSAGSTLALAGRPATVEQSRRIKGGLAVKFDVVDSRSAAEAVCGQVITVPRERLAPLPDGRYYYFDIIDMVVFDETGDKLGYVKEIIETGVNDVYVIERPEQGDLLIPALEDVVLSVSIVEKHMTVRVPEGLA